MSPQTWEKPSHVAEPRHLGDPIRTFDLAEAARKVRQEGPWESHGRNATTLVKLGGFRVVLMAFKAGTRMLKHQTDGRVTVQVLKGHVRLAVEEQRIDLPQGHLVALEQLIPHDVEAIEESDLLLCVSS